MLLDFLASIAISDFAFLAQWKSPGLRNQLREFESLRGHKETKHGPLAQSVEQEPFKLTVESSSLSGSTMS